MKNSRENIETLVAKIDQLKKDLEAAWRIVDENKKEEDQLLKDIQALRAELEEKMRIMTKQSEAIRRLKEKLRQSS